MTLSKLLPFHLILCMSISSCGGLADVGSAEVPATSTTGGMVTKPAPVANQESGGASGTGGTRAPGLAGAAPELESIPGWVDSGSACNLPEPNCVCPACELVGYDDLRSACLEVFDCFYNRCTIVGPGFEGALICPDSTCEEYQLPDTPWSTDSLDFGNPRRAAYVAFRCALSGVGTTDST